MLVVLGMVTVLVTSLVVGSTMSLRNQQASNLRDKALKYAQQGIETVRSLRDTDWVTFAAYSGSYCLDINNVLTSRVDTCQPLLDTLYERVVTFTYDVPNERMGVVMVVSWSSGSKLYSTNLETYYTNWK